MLFLFGWCWCFGLFAFVCFACVLCLLFVSAVLVFAVAVGLVRFLFVLIVFNTIICLRV